MNRSGRAIGMLLLLAGLGLAACASAATITIGMNGDKPRVAAVGPVDTKLQLEESDKEISLDLKNGLTCANVKADMLPQGTMGKSPLEVATSSEGCVLKLSDAALGVPSFSIQIAVNGKVASTKIVVARGKQEAPPRPNAGTGTDTAGEFSLATLLQRSCPMTFAIPNDLAKQDRAIFYVTPLGTVLQRSPDPIDENDVVEVHIWVDPRLKPLLRVKRTSAIRTLGSISIVGQDIKVKSLPGLTREGTGEEQPPCEELVVSLGDFAPGRAEVTISAFVDSKDIPLGSFDFVVGRLYHGTFSFGPVLTWNTEREFTLESRNDSTFIGQNDPKDPEVLWTIFYSAYLSGRRDLEKPPHNLREAVSLSLGVVPDDFSNHVLVGLSVDWRTFVFSVGGHWRRQSELEPTSGLAVGDPFTGTEIPTHRRPWTGDVYVGATLDLRAAAAFLTAAFGSAP